MNKFFVLALFVFLPLNTAFASVGTNTDNGVNYKMSYPIVYTNNKAIQDKINQDIYHYIAAFRDDYNAGKFYKGKFSYEVKLETDDYVSLMIIDSRWLSIRSPRDHDDVYGVVYDKHTGKKLPLSHFLKITVADLEWFYLDHLYNTAGNKIQANKLYSLKEVSNSYYLLGNGGIALIYRTFELAPYREGATTIRLTREEVDYFNRKNRN